MTDGEQHDRLAAENLLFRRLLDVGMQDRLSPFLQEALSLLVEAAGARQGYLELYDEDDDGRATAPRWWIAHGFSSAEIAEVRTLVSHGIIAATLAEGRIVSTASARGDARFEARPSVQRGQIDAVLCAPIGAQPPRGVLYLQGRTPNGPFSDEDEARVDLCARHLAPFVHRLLIEERRRTDSDPTLAARGRLRAERIVGRSAALAQVLREAAMAAPLNVSLLITGASGTGKTQLARVIHESSPRAGRPFLELNCGALPETLLENELFGSEIGAHSTATKRSDGKVGAAQHGTLFLDEISELSLTAQSKLLQLLQSKEYFPLGGTEAKRADVRIIAATNADLKELVAERRFRADLLFRLEVLVIRAPALAERREDIAELAVALLRDACDACDLPRLELSRSAIATLVGAEWPGNVRQLGSAIQRAAIRANDEQCSQVEASHVGLDGPEAPPAADGLTYQQATRQFQAAFVRQSLDDNGWNILQTSRRLDVARSYLYELMGGFGIHRGRPAR